MDASWTSSPKAGSSLAMKFWLAVIPLRVASAFTRLAVSGRHLELAPQVGGDKCEMCETLSLHPWWIPGEVALFVPAGYLSATPPHLPAQPFTDLVLLPQHTILRNN